MDLTPPLRTPNQIASRIAELEAEVGRLKESQQEGTAPGGAVTTPPTGPTASVEEVEKTRGENAQLVAKMREILVRYKVNSVLSTIAKGVGTM